MAKAKGTTLVGAVRFLRKNKEAARGALEPELHHYLEELVNEASWYPEEDLLQLIEAMVALSPGSREQTLEAMGAATAKAQLEGIYAHLRRDTSRSKVSRLAFALWSSMHDTGRIRVEELADEVVEFTLEDYALPSPAMCTILTGYFSESYRIQGAKQVTTRLESCIARGDDACVWRLRFER